jgi:dihydropteroate synthase
MHEARLQYDLTLPTRALHLGQRTLIMGVLNVTPDSFSDGGEFLEPERAVERAVEIEAAGADILDIGGESSRPGSQPVSVDEELRRVIPVIERLVGRLRIPISIDTTKYDVARAALEQGAEIINDISGLSHDVRLADVATRFKAALVLMHMRGTPETMQQLPPSSDIFAEIEDGFRRSIQTALGHGVNRSQLVLDPGIGFGKTVEQNLAIINNLDRFAKLNLPVLIGTSRKIFIGKITRKGPKERLFGTAASVTAAILRGAHIVRLHDVDKMIDAVRVADAVASTSRC